MIIGIITLLCGLLISSVAIFYSVIGLISIFPAAVIPIIIMGISLEVAKLAATIWLKQNWNVAPKLLKGYLVTSVIVLMLITSLGVFGFLSKAHIDQTISAGNNTDQITMIDQQIKNQNDNIDSVHKALKQLDDAVDQTMARSTTENGAIRSATMRRRQKIERENFQRDITNAQQQIIELNKQKAVVSKDVRKSEAEVGPIKYVAAFIYGDNAGPQVLEKAVRWIIVLLVLVFDPLAVSLLLASQFSFQYYRDSKRKKDEESDIPLYSQMLNPIPPPVYETDISELQPTHEPVVEEPVVEEPNSDIKITHEADAIVIEDNHGQERLPTYVQNEEQSTSGQWSKVSKPITENEYLDTAIKKLRS